MSDIIARRIRAEGPITIAAFIDLAAHHPIHGYYQRRNPFGAKGDFITAPDICQAFGELIGLWLCQAWQDAGRPTPFRLVELGPGRGQLMADLIRATASVPGFLEAADILMVEPSLKLQAQQRDMLQDQAPACRSIAWATSWDQMPTDQALADQALADQALADQLSVAHRPTANASSSGPLFLLANEVFDALPVHQLGLDEEGWRERALMLSDAGDDIGDGAGGLVPTMLPADPALTAMIEGRDTAPLGSLAEVSPARAALAAGIAQQIDRDGGLALIIDYGAIPNGPTGDTLQGIKAHRFVDPFATPGDADLTAHVDFQALAKAALTQGAAVFGPVPQGTFLRTLGIEARIAALLQQANAEQATALRSALFRLTDASAMGELFKILVLAKDGAPLPPGFSAPSQRPAP